jgi:hypothetical protein
MTGASGDDSDLVNIARATLTRVDRARAEARKVLAERQFNRGIWIVLLSAAAGAGAAAAAVVIVTALVRLLVPGVGQ